MNIPPELEAQIVHSTDCRCNQCRRKDAWQGVAPDPDSEKQFQAFVVLFAQNLLWDVYHTHNSRKSRKGYPDLTMWRERLIFAELKTETGRLTADQQSTIESLRKAGQEVYVWRPSDWNTIVEKLT